MMVVGIVLISSIFVSVFLSWDSDRGIEREVGGYFLRFLAGMSLIVFGNVTRDIATRKPNEDQARDEDFQQEENDEVEISPTLYSIANPFDFKSDRGTQRS
jgi:hypothetical protein